MYTSIHTVTASLTGWTAPSNPACVALSTGYGRKCFSFALLKDMVCLWILMTALAIAMRSFLKISDGRLHATWRHICPSGVLWRFGIASLVFSLGLFHEKSTHYWEDLERSSPMKYEVDEREQKKNRVHKVSVLSLFMLTKDISITIQTKKSGRKWNGVCV